MTSEIFPSYFFNFSLEIMVRFHQRSCSHVSIAGFFDSCGTQLSKFGVDQRLSANLSRTQMISKPEKKVKEVLAITKWKKEKKAQRKRKQ